MGGKTKPDGIRSLLRAMWLAGALGAVSAVPSAATGPDGGTPSTAAFPDAPRPSVAVDLVGGDLEAAQGSSSSLDWGSADVLRGSDDRRGAALAAATSASVSGGLSERKLTPRELDAACQSGTLRGKPCRVSWGPMLWEAFEATAFENAGNIALDTETRHDLTTNPYWSTYVKCVEQYRFGQWSDDTPFAVHGIGHPMQGAAMYSVFEQNDPKSRGLLFENSGRYWRAHLKAMVFVTIYEVQWKIGPASEASIGNSGLNSYYTPSVVGRTTNETGFQDFVITPVYGLGWHIAEDLVDRFVMPHIWKRTHSKWILTALTPLTPTRVGANWLRYRPSYYRDYELTPLR